MEVACALTPAHMRHLPGIYEDIAVLVGKHGLTYQLLCDWNGYFVRHAQVGHVIQESTR